MLITKKDKYNNNIEWICEKNKISRKMICIVERALSIRFPKDYIKCIKKYHAGYPRPHIFKVNGNEEVFNHLLSFNKGDADFILENYNDVKEYLVEKIIPFASDPFGNFLCFDYRFKRNPSIVFWEHEVAYDDKELAISFVCDTFTQLLQSLHNLDE